jgi:GntR family transcriptional regulator/MocR family aminotransferase
MLPLIDRAALAQHFPDRPHFEQIAGAFESAIRAGQLRAGDRLPTVRQLSTDLGMSGATIVAAYNLLTRRGWTRGEVGRGTFVVGVPGAGPPNGTREPLPAPSPVAPHRAVRQPPPWRRRALLTSSARLRVAYPTALDCTSGKPDVTLLPAEIVRAGWRAAVESFAPRDLQYAGPEALPELARQLLPRLALDGVTARASDLVIGSSAQQFIVLTLTLAGIIETGTRPIVAVEEPGYQTAIDTFERVGCRVIGIAVDEEGAIPESLDAALARGAHVAFFIPRVQNPTGVSWTARRTGQLADVLAAHPGVVAIEDDQFAGVAREVPGSLLADPRIEDRVIYIRSFAKAIAPDLRLAVAVARPRLRAMLAEAKTFADGWSSRLAQRALATALADPALDRALLAARAEYARRRDAILAPLNDGLALLGGWATGADGVNLWLHLPPGIDALEVIERAASRGVLLAPGEPFFIRPGHSDVIRLSVGGLGQADLGAIADTVLQATQKTAADRNTAMSV